MHINTCMHYISHRGKPIVVSAHRVSELAEKRREKKCIFRCCGVGRGMQCFSGVRGVSDRAVMWGSCMDTLHTKITRQQSRWEVRWTCLCYASLHTAETMCSVQKYWIMCLAWTTFQNKALFCIKMATIQQHILNIAKPPLAYFTVIYIPSPLTAVQNAARWVFKHNLL